MKEKNWTFSVQVTGTKEHEWQGSVHTPDGRELPFRSVLELLGEMNAALQRGDGC
jgi:hypothetical protein